VFQPPVELIFYWRVSFSSVFSLREFIQRKGVMIIYPAIDLRGGRVVRLIEGDPQQETVFSDDPVVTSMRWKDAGADWLHLVNLDGALGEGGLDLNMLAQIAASGLKVQFGGGLRSLDDAQRALDQGATRIVLGTMVVRNPELAGEAVQRFGAEAVAVALDAKDGLVAIDGWQHQTAWTPMQLGQYFANAGVRHALYTDINRDGKLQGANVQGVVNLTWDTGLAVIASGGVSSLEDIRALAQAEVPVAGVVIGKALYTRMFTLQDALAISREAGQFNQA
jgi:phosphoribosylformimino-5-aminoimidazole carboxamide ribotide isomerase